MPNGIGRPKDQKLTAKWGDIDALIAWQKSYIKKLMTVISLFLWLVPEASDIPSRALALYSIIITRVGRFIRLGNAELLKFRPSRRRLA